MKSSQRLETVGSMHEQREFAMHVLPQQGVWLEIGTFIPVIEAFELRERWECIDKIRDEHKIILKLKRLDHEQDRAIQDQHIQEILQKHGDILSASYLAMFARGMYLRREKLGRFKRKLERIQNKIAFYGDPEKAKLAEEIEAFKKAMKRKASAIRSHEKHVAELEEQWRGKYGEGYVSQGHSI